MITAGVDMGAKTIKVVILRNGLVTARCKAPGGLRPADTAENLLHEAMERAGVTIADLTGIMATGTGRSITPHATGSVTEATADARGIASLNSRVRTVVDVGAEEARGIKMSSEGKVIDVAVNEKCAAGSGAFTESMARALELPVEEFGRISLSAARAVPMNAQCTVFAESEVISLIHANTPKADISRAVHDAIASRVAAMVRRVGLEREVVLIGGVAHNVGFVEAFKRTLAIEELLVPEHPEYVGALGAALLAASTAPDGDRARGAAANA